VTAGPAGQAGYDVRFEWGMAGAVALAPSSDVVVVVDVLRFTTAVEVAVSRGSEVTPLPWTGGESAEARAMLSPALLAETPPAGRFELPSPNGSAISVAVSRCGVPVVAGCLRNATAVSRLGASAGDRISIIAAGEQWPDGSLRPALEDLVGCGAILAGLPAAGMSPEARAAADAFRPQRVSELGGVVSARELVERGLEVDLAWAFALDVSDVVPCLEGGSFRLSRGEAR
jgi:2-phosphosulfolactate phosphatase